MPESMRSCTKTGCRWPAVATLAYRYHTAEVWLRDLEEDHPATHDLCPHHAGGLTVPRGWTLVDERTVSEPVREPSADEVVEAARARRRAQESRPAIAEPAVPQHASRYAALMEELPRLAAAAGAGLGHAVGGTAGDGTDHGPRRIGGMRNRAADAAPTVPRPADAGESRGADRPVPEGLGSQGPGSQGPGSQGPGSQGPGSQGPVNQGPVNLGPVNLGPVSQGPVSQGPVSQGPVSQGPLPEVGLSGGRRGAAVPLPAPPDAGSHQPAISVERSDSAVVVPLHRSARRDGRVKG